MVSLLFYSDIEDAYDEPERLGRFCGQAQAVRDEETLVIGGGDSIGPSLLSTQTGGRHAVDIYERLGTDIEVFGNHEFDYGLGSLQDIIRSSPQTWLAANLYNLGGEQLFAAGFGVKPYVVRDVGGTSIGLVGLTHESIHEIAPHADGLTTSDPVTTARDISEQLDREEVDIVVGVAHTEKAEKIVCQADVDVLLVGHVNERLERRVGDTIVVQTVGSAKELVEVSLEDSGIRVTRHLTETAPVDESVVSFLRSHCDGNDGNNPDESLSVGHDGRPFHSIVSEALQSQTGADIALLNTDAVRNEPQSGSELKPTTVLRAIPFPQPVVVIEATGEELLNVVSNSMFSDERHESIAYSGMTINETENGFTVQIDSDPVRENERYTIATLAYIIESNRTFDTIGEDHIVKNVAPHHECIADYLTEGD